MDTITETPTATESPSIHPAPVAERTPLEPLEQLVTRLAADALARRRPGGHSVVVDLCVDMDGTISIEDAAGLGATAYQREVHIEISAYTEPCDADAVMTAAAIEHGLLASTDDSPSILATAARLRGSSDLVELAIVRQHGVPWTLNAEGRRSGAYVIPERIAQRLHGVAGSRVIAAYAWSALGYPAYALIHVVPALASPLPVVRFGVHNHEIDPVDEESAWLSPVASFRALTRADSLAALPAGSDPIAQEIHLARTAGERAESRRRSAAAVLCQYVLDEEWAAGRADITAWVRREDSAYPALREAHLPTLLTVAQERALGVIAALEVHGIGGPGGYSGDSTERMSWASGLGKGRRQASDGEAWTAAIGALAAGHVSPEDVLETLPEIRHCDLEWPMSYALDRVQAIMTYDADEARAWSDVARSVYARATAEDAPYTDGGAVALGRRYGVDRAAGDAS